jgi:hypothetical protein
MRRNRAIPRGVGVRARPSRTPGGRVGYEAWVYDCQRGRKRRKTFTSFEDARRWRHDQIRQMYVVPDAKKGHVDKAYEHLRKAAQELDRSIPDLDGQARMTAKAALTSIYDASDRALLVMGVS